MMSEPSAMPSDSIPSNATGGGIVAVQPVTSNGDDSQQTRFSFYNADEFKVASSGNGIASAGSDGAAVPVPREQQRFNFYNATEINKTHKVVQTVTQTVQALETADAAIERRSTYNNQHDHHQQQYHGKDHTAQPRYNNNNNLNTSGSSSNLLDSSDILKSLQEHEQQRLEILGGPKQQPRTTSAPLQQQASAVVNATGFASTNGDGGNVVKNLSNNNGSSSSNNATAAPIVSQTSGTSNLSHCSSGEESNPYEDAIKEALQLLRKHRSPDAAPALSSGGGGNVSSTTSSRSATRTKGGGGGAARAQRANDEQKRLEREFQDLMIRTSADAPASEQELLLQQQQQQQNSTNTDMGEAYQAEIEARRKQRQERMARYASRLAELKQDGPPTASGNAADSYLDDDDDDEGAEHELGPPSMMSRTAHRGHRSFDDDILASRSDDLSNDGGGGGGSIVSALSNTHTHNRSQEEDVQKGVERVLLAILERANSRGRTVLDESLYSLGKEQHAREEKKSESQPADALLKVMSDLLGPTTSQEEDVEDDEDDDTAEISAQLPQQPLAVEEDPSTSLATQEDPALAIFETEVPDPPSQTTSIGYASTQLDHDDDDEEDFHVQDVVAAAADEVVISHTAHDELDRVVAAHVFRKEVPVVSSVPPTSPRLAGSIQATSPRSGRSIDRSEDDESTGNGDDSLAESSGSSSYDETDDNETDDNVEEDDDDDEDDEEEESGSYAEESSDDDDGVDYDSEKAAKARYTGVLGPLSQKSGGTTGVVLDPESSYEDELSSDGESSEASHSSRAGQSVTSPSILESLSAAVSMVTGVTSVGTQDPTILPQKDKYAQEDSGTDDDDDDESCTEDSEARELMQSLCAHHMMPLGGDPTGRMLDKLPDWDEANPDEAGYRIIRLTESQLRRVEKEYGKMVAGLKHKSQRRHLSPNSNGTDESAFERDLRAAEDLLDQEEKRLKTAQKVLAGHTKKTTTAVAKASTNEISSDTEEEVLEAFPGVKSAGKGEMGELEFFSLPVIFKSHVTGFEPTKDMVLEAGNVVAGQYLVEGILGSAAFSTAYKCIDLSTEEDDNGCQEEVCLKVIKNTKDFFDQSLDEIKILELLRQTGQCHENYIVEMKTFFYHREHLIIVTELLRQNLFEFGKFIIDSGEEPYFTMNRLAYITRQCLVALNFVHNLGLVHSDIKPENILLASYSRAHAKVIDFGSSCYLTDRQSSYIQSRSYRAPEVVLGLPYDGRIDIWSLGCVVAEMFTGEVTFQNDSIVSMLSRIEAICGAFPRHMVAQGRQSSRTFTKCGLLYEKVTKETAADADESYTDESSNDDENKVRHVDVFQPKRTTLSQRLGFSSDLMVKYDSGKSLPREEKRQAMFVDLVRKLLTIDPEVRPTAGEALEHPLMQYAATLTEDDVKYPSR